MTQRKRAATRKTQTNRKQHKQHGHASQLKEVEQLAQRALNEAGRLEGPMRHDWTLDEAFPPPIANQQANTVPLRVFLIVTRIDPNITCTESVLVVGPDSVVDDPATAVSEIDGKEAVVVGAALLVRDAYERAHGPARATRDLARRYAALQREARLFFAQQKDELLLQLRNLALTNSATTAEPEKAQLRFQDQYRRLAIVDRSANALEEVAEGLAKSLDEDVLEESATYENRRHGPMMHFIALLWHLGLSVRDIAEVLGEIPKQEAFEHVTEWEDAAMRAEHNVGVRVLRARSKVSAPQLTRADGDRVSFQQRAVVLICRHVEPGQPVSLHLGSGKALSTTVAESVENLDRGSECDQTWRWTVLHSTTAPPGG